MYFIRHKNIILIKNRKKTFKEYLFLKIRKIKGELKIQFIQLLREKVIILKKKYSVFYIVEKFK